MITIPSTWLIIFVKAPSPGAVKTRLSPPLSPREAAGLYRCLVLETLATVRQLPGIRVVVAYDANKTYPNMAWSRLSLPMFLQYGRHLGERLTHAFQWAFAQRATEVVVIGSDAPDLSAAWIRRAVTLLQRHDVVLGPTHDGGYHLVGLRRPAPKLFEAIPWSTGRVLQETLTRVRRLRYSVGCLPTIHDLDTPEDLERAIAHVGSSRSKTAAYLRKLSLSHVAIS